MGMRVRLTPQLTRFLDEAASQGTLSQVPPAHQEAWGAGPSAVRRRGSRGRCWEEAWVLGLVLGGG